MCCKVPFIAEHDANNNMAMPKDESSVAMSDNDDDELSPPQSKKSIAKQELKWIRNLRVAVIILLVAATVVASFLVYRVAKRYEDDIFRNKVSIIFRETLSYLQNIKPSQLRIFEQQHNNRPAHCHIPLVKHSKLESSED